MNEHICDIKIEPELLNISNIKLEKDLKYEENPTGIDPFDIEITCDLPGDNENITENCDKQKNKEAVESTKLNDDFDVDAVIGEIMANVDRDHLSKAALKNHSLLTVRNGDEMPYHKIVINGQANGYCCTICDHVVRGKSQIEAHVVQHLPGEASKKEIRRSARIRKKNKRRKAPTMNNRFEKCRTEFKEVKIGNGTRYQCNICHVITDGKFTITNHVSEHKDRLLIKCSFCNSKMKLKSSMVRHLLQKHNLLVKIHDIQEDGSVRNGMEKRRTRVPYSCSVCNFKTRTKRAVAGHMSRRHGIIKKTVDIPGPKFVLAGSKKIRKNDAQKLNYAVLSRGNEKFFACTLCGKAFTKRDSFTVHYQTHKHLSIYPCSLCPYTTRNAWSAKKHVRFRHCIRHQSPERESIEVGETPNAFDNNETQIKQEIIDLASDDDLETENFSGKVKIEIAESTLTDDKV